MLRGKEELRRRGQAGGALVMTKMVLFSFRFSIVVVVLVMVE